MIGLDLGGTNSVFGIVDGDGEIIATTSIKTQAFQCVDQYVEESVKAVMQIVEQVGGMEKIRAMGIGAPCGNYYKGTIENAANLVWAKGIVPLADMFAEKLGIPVAITNDANCGSYGRNEIWCCGWHEKLRRTYFRNWRRFSVSWLTGN